MRYDPPSSAASALRRAAPPLAVLALNRLRRSLHRRQPARVPLVGNRNRGALAHDPRAELNRLIMAEQQAGLAPQTASTGSWSWPVSPTPPQPPSRPLRETAGGTVRRPLLWLRPGYCLEPCCWR